MLSYPETKEESTNISTSSMTLISSMVSATKNELRSKKTQVPFLYL